MSWCDGYEKEWKEIISTIASEIKKDEIIIEKDLIQSIFLFKLSKYDFPFVFKGGTSLSKAYNLIDRFSEDLDLSISRKITESEKRKSKEIILKISNELKLTLINPSEVKSRHNYNKYVFKYASLFTLNKVEVIIETSYYNIVYPIQSHKISCFVGDFCRKNNIKFPIPFNAMEFNMNVQSLERTFIDKIFAVCDYRLENMWDRDSRHLYDIAKILPHINITSDFKNLIKKVRMDRMMSKNNPSAQLKYNISELLKEIIEKRFFEPDYNNLTTKLLYEDFSYDDSVNNGISKVVEMGIF